MHIDYVHFCSVSWPVPRIMLHKKTSQTEVFELAGSDLQVYLEKSMPCTFILNHQN